jgi:hypothetical protein
MVIWLDCGYEYACNREAITVYACEMEPPSYEIDF